MLELLVTIVIGFVIGLVARAVLPGRDSYGLIVTTLVGIGGALLGSYVATELGIIARTGVMRFVIAVVGAVVLLLILRVLRGKGS